MHNKPHAVHVPRLAICCPRVLADRLHLPSGAVSGRTGMCPVCPGHGGDVSPTITLSSLRICVGKGGHSFGTVVGATVLHPACLCSCRNHIVSANMQRAGFGLSVGPLMELVASSFAGGGYPPSC